MQSGTRHQKTTAHIIVLGNEKGGSGKSTTAMHVAIALMRMGYKIGTIDLDARQGTITRYMRGRFDFVGRHGKDLPSPTHLAIDKSVADSVSAQKREEENFLMMALVELGASHDFIVIDTPGSDTNLSRLAHSYADTLITPVNDSFVDLSVLANIDPYSYEILGPSIYTQMVDEQKYARKHRDGQDIDWIVMRNRLGHLDAKNKRDVGEIIHKIGTQFGFREAAGFGERVIFKELFLKGLTLMDLQEDPDNNFTMSQIGARQEVRNLIKLIGPENYKTRPIQHHEEVA